MEIVTDSLFPSLVWTTLFDDRESFNVRMLDLANEMRNSDPAGVAKTNVKGWQSPNILQNLNEFEEIRAIEGYDGWSSTTRLAGAILDVAKPGRRQTDD